MELAQRKMGIALTRSMNKEEILSHDLFGNRILFDFASTTTKTNKSLIVVEIEKDLFSTTTTVTEFKKESTLFTHKIIEFMSHMRQRGGLSTSKTFNTANNSVMDLM